MTRTRIAVVLILLLGCNKKLHENTGVLLDALGSGDYPAIEAVAEPSLLEELTEDSFAQMSATYQMLGALEHKKRTSTGVQNGVSYIVYKLEFEKGNLNLSVRSTSKGKLDGFTFEGDAWQEAISALLEDRATKLVDALAAGDKSAFPKLFTADLLKDVEAKGPPTMPDLGKRTKIELVEASDKSLSSTYRVVYEKQTFKVRVGMRGGKISSFDFAPE